MYLTLFHIGYAHQCLFKGVVFSKIKQRLVMISYSYISVTYYEDNNREELCEYLDDEGFRYL